MGGGKHHVSNGYDVIEYITISTTGNAVDFGDFLCCRRIFKR